MKKTHNRLREERDKLAYRSKKRKAHGVARKHTPEHKQVKDHAENYDKHEGHSTEMFLKKFWASLILTIPVVLYCRDQCGSFTEQKNITYLTYYFSDI